MTLTTGQLTLNVDLSDPQPAPTPPATYWENRGPRNWQPVLVTLRYGHVAGHATLDLPHLVTGKLGPRNVVIQREDGTQDVVPVRNLRLRKPR